MPDAKRISFLGDMARESFTCRRLVGGKARAGWLFLLLFLLVSALAAVAHGQQIIAAASAEKWNRAAGRETIGSALVVFRTA